MNGKMESFLLASLKRAKCKEMASYTYQMAESYKVYGKMAITRGWQEYWTYRMNNCQESNSNINHQLRGCNIETIRTWHLGM